MDWDPLKNCVGQKRGAEEARERVAGEEERSGSAWVQRTLRIPDSRRLAPEMRGPLSVRRSYERTPGGDGTRTLGNPV
uniref:Uncharacterized protein n=1 Tax=Knipowitschia caucasica TaxID=637954 RepID=A0AAV2J2Y9_KNICA